MKYFDDICYFDIFLVYLIYKRRVKIVTIITCRNNTSISIFGRGAFRLQIEYIWCIIQVKSKHFLEVFKKIGKTKKNVTAKREFKFGNSSVNIKI
ncbi:Uncharacterized protein FWK35_00024663 [Aphis craccivora]|uniref:Uncharacterized protein n=1 Tax=Aphis craccivora TaxID=307492 RepID=A0A6G0Y192_APHCR|nr:Uncharacterized protein FWK35_00024663 [Aphis craccivora]